MKKTLFAIATIALMQNACSATPKANPHFKVGKPYTIKGKVYYPNVQPKYSKIGLASWYGPNFDKKLTANGEIFDRRLMTAAHKTLPLPSIVKVTNLENGRKIYVRVNDRGPYAGERIIDLSEKAAEKLGFKKKGVAKVLVELDGPASKTALNSVRISEAEKKFVLSQIQVEAGEENASKLQATSTAQGEQIQSITTNLTSVKNPLESKAKQETVDFVSAKGAVGMVADASGKIGEVVPEAKTLEEEADASKTIINKQVSENSTAASNAVKLPIVNNAADNAPKSKERPASLKIKEALKAKQLANGQVVKEAESKIATTTSTANDAAKKSGDYFVQIRSSQDKNAAEIEARKVSSKFTSLVEEANIEGKKYFRVQLGGFNSRSEAEEIRNKVKNLGYKDAFIVTKNTI